MKYDYSSADGSVTIKTDLKSLLILSKALPVYKETLEHDFRKGEVTNVLENLHVAIVKTLDQQTADLESTRREAVGVARKAGILVPS
tara:strand:- start:416 stop:676 length:261 start_codon:yes stop_codon:yes gene_type:complete